MSRARYILHMTLGTGDIRRSWRHEVEDGVVSLIRQQIAEMLAGLPVEVRPGYAMAGAAAGAALLATVSRDRVPLVTIAVAAKAKASARLWDELRRPVPGAAAAAGEPPQAPWVAARLWPALARDPEAAAWLGDFERCLAWAWIEGGQS
jgi:hypothetical protein